jgi:putative ABC transport system permease protein
MRVLLLAWRYCAHNRLKTAILVACLTLTFFLPIAVHLLVRRYSAELVARAEATPLVLGAKGNRFDLCLSALYFRGEGPEGFEYGEAEKLRETGLATPVPVHARFTARGLPVVGTSIEYFEFRGLDVAEGTPPLVLGDAVLGCEAARALGLAPGSTLLSDQRSLYDISRSYPLKMHVVGVLAETGTPDDHAVFVDVKTAWVIQGLAHGHEDLADETSPRLVLGRKGGNVVGTAAVFEYTEVTPENIDSFHFHGDPARFPLTAVIAVPHDRKSETILKARYTRGPEAERVQMIEPVRVIGELTGVVFRIEAFFRANFAVVAASTGLFLVLVVLLSLRIRRREAETLFKIGASRTTVFWMQAAELGIVLGMSVAVAAAAAGAILAFAPELVRVM